MTLLNNVPTCIFSGYGHVAPKTSWGRLVTIIYALIGIPLTFLYLSNIGNFLADCFRLFYKKVSGHKSTIGKILCWASS